MLTVLLIVGKRIAHLGSIVECTVTLDEDDKLDLIHRSGASEMACPIEGEGCLGCSSELSERTEHKTSLVLALAELEISILRVDDLRSRVQVSVACSGESIRELVLEDVGSVSVRSICAGAGRNIRIVSIDKVTDVACAETEGVIFSDHRPEPFEIILEYHIRILLRSRGLDDGKYCLDTLVLDSEDNVTGPGSSLVLIFSDDDNLLSHLDQSLGLRCDGDPRNVGSHRIRMGCLDRDNYLGLTVADLSLVLVDRDERIEILSGCTLDDRDILLSIGGIDGDAGLAKGRHCRRLAGHENLNALICSAFSLVDRDPVCIGHNSEVVV